MALNRFKSGISCEVARLGRGPAGGACVAMTQSWLMQRYGAIGAILFWAAVLAAQVPAAEPVVVSAEHPRLLLRPARLRLLKRERDRTSMRWQQFEGFVAGKAPMPERGFAYALYYQISEDASFGRQAIEWALGPGSDIRQVALVYDWCQDLLTEPQRRTLTARLQKSLADTAADASVPAVRSRVLAAVALFDHVPQVPQRELEKVVRDWWEVKTVPALKSGRVAISRDDAYPLWELMHVVRDTTNIEMRESFPRFFKDFPIEHLISYYPAVYPGPDGEYYIGSSRKITEPDLRLAMLSRAAELAMVAYDANALESQVLQGWLMHDKYQLRSTLGAPYEFLWANPYQPGLSYYHVPLVYHNPDFGKLFIRSGWEDSAEWFGYFDGVMQMFSEGHLMALNPQLGAEPLPIKEAIVCFGSSARKFRVKVEEEKAVFVLGLAPRTTYLVEIDDQEMYDADTDAGGILKITDIPRGKQTGVRIHEAPPAPTR